MDQDIAVRLANEGVPVRAIARAVQLPSADVRLGLESARQRGYLIEIPREDWPSGSPRQWRLVKFAEQAGCNKSALQLAARIVFDLEPAEASILLALLLNEEVVRDRLGAYTTNSVRTKLCRLRARLAPFGLHIVTLYGHGYHMSLVHRRKAQGLILAKARPVKREVTPRAKCLMRRRPWVKLGISRATWYRQARHIVRRESVSETAHA